MYKDLKIEGLNDRISRKSQSPCSSKASNGIQQSQSINNYCKLHFELGRYLDMKKAKEFIINTLAPETKLKTNKDRIVSLYWNNDSAFFSRLHSYAEATTISDEVRSTEIVQPWQEIFSCSNNKLEILQAERTPEHFTDRNLNYSDWNLLQKIRVKPNKSNMSPKTA